MLTATRREEAVMSETGEGRPDAIEEERELREQEEAVKEHEPAEREPGERAEGDADADRPAPPGNVQQPRG
jgi:hypothetical protein